MDKMSAQSPQSESDGAIALTNSIVVVRLLRPPPGGMSIIGSEHPPSHSRHACEPSIEPTSQRIDQAIIQALVITLIMIEFSEVVGP